ncbi:hypothetical protein ABJI51_16630 [Amycolatopsis sp. NEAU-NG30]|uniref:ATP-binding protein n=1 Tax=Amycolatopsis melonis TaxID=3156488 RepID=A0ABV0LEI5_9PSEU
MNGGVTSTSSAAIQPASPAGEPTPGAGAAAELAAEQAGALRAAGSGLPAEWITARDKPIPPALGWRIRGAGRSPLAPKLPRWVGTTAQLAGLYPFVLSAGTPDFGVPIGVHQITREPVCLDVGEYLRRGLVTNTATYLTGEPGTGKSTIGRRLMWGLSLFGVGVMVPADLKGEHRLLVEGLGGTCVTLGRGLHRINLLDSGPLGGVLEEVPAAERARLRQEIQTRALTLTEGALTISSGRPLNDTERLGLALAYELFFRRRPKDTPTLADLLRILQEAPEEIQAPLHAADTDESKRMLRPLLVRLQLILRGPLAGLFEGQSSFTIDPRTPGACLDLSRLVAGADDAAVAIAMLAAWGWSSALIDAGQVTGRRRTWIQFFDEFWRVLRAGSGMVEIGDQAGRIGRQRGVQAVLASHAVADFLALKSEEDKAKAAGIIARCSTVIVAAQPQSELDDLARIVPLTQPEMALIRSWAAPPTWNGESQHPGRGKYMLKQRERIGMPIRMLLAGSERPYHDTDQAWR